MEILLTSLAFALAALCAGAMGFAIQRGGTCTVAAVDEVVSQRKFNRLLAMAEASLWVAGGLVIARSLQLLPQMPTGYAITQWTVIGAVLLGLGAYVNGACVFGAIARFGSGQWAYLATPIGFFAGCATVGSVFSLPTQQGSGSASPVLQAPAWVAALFVAFVIWRLARPLAAQWSEPGAGSFASGVWSPHAATSVIGIAFLLILILVGSWAYTEVLADLAASGMTQSLAAKSLLLAALWLGAVWGGWGAGRFRSTPVCALQLGKCLAGGVMMGWGSLLIPGANDGLILIGMPLLWPYAWLAFGVMCVSIAAALWLRKTLPVLSHDPRG